MGLISAIAETHTDIDAELVRAWRLFDPQRYAKQVLGKYGIRSELLIRDMELLPYLTYLDALTKLRLDVAEAADMTALGGRPTALVSLNVRRRPRAGLRGIERWNGLLELGVTFENTVADLRPLAELVSLRKLRIEVVRGIAVKIDLSAVIGLRNLEEIMVMCDARYELYIGPIIGHSMRRLVVEDYAQITGESAGLTRAGVEIVHCEHNAV